MPKRYIKLMVTYITCGYLLHVVIMTQVTGAAQFPQGAVFHQRKLMVRC